MWGDTGRLHRCFLERAKPGWLCGGTQFVCWLSSFHLVKYCCYAERQWLCGVGRGFFYECFCVFYS